MSPSCPFRPEVPGGTLCLPWCVSFLSRAEVGSMDETMRKNSEASLLNPPALNETSVSVEQNWN